MLSPLRSRFGARLREPFGKAGLTVAVIALVFAMFGGAYAATNSGGGEDSATASKKNKRNAKRNNRKGKQGGLNAKQKRQVLALAKRFQGSGPQGPAGLPGANGLPGAPGAKGDKGSDGSDGAQGPQGPKGDTGATGATGAQGPQGIQGEPWTAGGTLPSGETQTGAWAIGRLSEGAVPEGAFGASILITPISFALPLAASLDKDHVHYINPAGKELIFNELTFEVEKLEPADCGSGIGPGVNAANPQASPGHLCVYAGEEEKVGVEVAPGVSIPPSIVRIDGSASPGASTAGAMISFFAPEKDAIAHGSFAVTAP